VCKTACHVIAELRLCEVFIGEHNQCDSMAALRSLCSSLMVQAPIDPEFESKYWASNPNDSYSRGIRMWNERVCFVKDPGVFYHGFTEMKDRDVADCMANVCVAVKIV
jgi:hypothetical protein